MRRLSFERVFVAGPLFLVAGVIVGTSALGYYAGQALAYFSLVFGVLFFAYAARYYVATISVLVAPSATNGNGKNGSNGSNGKNGSPHPMVSVHLALYNEERVVDRLLTACSNLDYPNYEVVVVDDSNDGTVEILKEWIFKQLKSEAPKMKIIHRENRQGFKGGALNEALKHTDPRAEYIAIFDADFVPGPDILTKFLAYFNIHGPNGNGNGSGYGTGRYSDGKLAAVQGYQWHTLNRTENWLTRGVSCEFSGNYMVDRTFQEVTGVMKMVAGSVYLIRADVLKKYGWSRSITEDWELTLRLYENGYKVLYTPLVQAPAECPSTLGKLVRQRMRWAEGHTYNVKKHFLSILTSTNLGFREKLEFLYFAPYYLQSVFLILGTFFWLTSDIVLGAKLPFWTAEIGWGLVLTNLLALPIMSFTGLFLERRARRDFRGIASQFLLIYALAPYQAYASLKGLIEPVEGSWVRTFKSGRLAGFPGKLEPRKVVKNVLPPRKRATLPTARVTMVMVLGLSVLFATAFVQGQMNGSQMANPAYYFYDQPAPPGYAPYSSTPPGSSFLMHIPLPPGPDAITQIGSLQSSGLFFFSDPAPSTQNLPFGASVSIHIWVDAGGAEGQGGTVNPAWLTSTQTTETSTQPVPCDVAPQLHTTTTCTQTSTQTESTSTKTNPCDWECTTTSSSSTVTTTSPEAGNLKFRIDLYNPANNSITQIPGAGETEVFHLQPGVNYYEASWGNIAQNKVILKGETIMVSIWCPDCKTRPTLIYNSPAHASNIDFPIEVPEDSFFLASVALIIPGVAGLVVNQRVGAGSGDSEARESGRRRVQTIIIVAAALIFMTLPLVITFNDALASVASATGFDRVASLLAPYEAATVSALLRGLGFVAGSSANSVWIGGGFIPVTALIDWNCAGWQGFFLFGITSVVGLGEVRNNRGRVLVLLAGLGGVFVINVLRILLVVLIGYSIGYPAALIFHDYGGAVMTLGWLLVFWNFVLRHEKSDISEPGWTDAI